MLEYTVVVACLAAALIGMQIYIKRSIQGRIRGATDDIGEQYSSLYTNSSLTQTITSNVTINGTPRFIDVNGENKEIIQVERNENMTINVGAGSYEKTGSLRSEKLFQ